MTRDTLEEFMQDMQAEFLAGKLLAFAQRFSEPLVIYSLEGVLVLRTQKDFIAKCDQYRAAVLAMSVVHSDVTIVSRDEVMNNRMRATIRVVDFNARGVPVTGSLIRYFLIKNDGTFKIEMVEYLENPLPPEEIERLVH